MDQPTRSIPPKMLYYKEQFTQFSKLGFIIRLKYLDMFLPNALRVAIGQLRVSSDQLEVENDHANKVFREERICRLCHILRFDKECNKSDHPLHPCQYVTPLVTLNNSTKVFLCFDIQHIDYH